MFVEKCRVLSFPRISDARGTLTYIEAAKHVPFDVKRVFYLYDVPPGESRGAHAHRQLQQVLICLAGSFDVLVADGVHERQFRLCHPAVGLYIPPLIWDTEVNFAPGSVCMVLASDFYDEGDYYRNRDAYLDAVAAARSAAGHVASDSDL
jgi:hypothetical protein